MTKSIPRDQFVKFLREFFYKVNDYDKIGKIG